MQTALVPIKRVSQIVWRTSVAMLAMLMFATVCRTVQAVILADGDGMGNTTAPADDPGWANVGHYGDFTATYLGNGWAIAADHVPLAPQIVFGQRAVPVVVGSEVTLSNPPVESLSADAKALLDKNGISQSTELTDLRLIRLAEEPGLPALTISAQPPPFLDEMADVILIGYGRDRESDLSSWYVDDLGGGQFDWVEVTSPADDGGGHDYRVDGYKYVETQTKRWGTNTIIADGLGKGEDYDVFSLLTQFRSDPAIAAEFESQATTGDSGGAVFYRSQDGWQLAGILYAVTPTVGGLITSGQPEDTAVFGNFTALADLSIYREQIEEIIWPRQLQAGDADQDDDFDNLDIVQVLQRAKYLTGQPATWGDGDWDGAPGGSVGNPPPGNGLFDQLDIIAALARRSCGYGYCTGPYAALAQSRRCSPPRCRNRPAFCYWLWAWRVWRPSLWQWSFLRLAVRGHARFVPLTGSDGAA